MKIFLKIGIVFAVVLLASCRDTKKEDAETKAVLEQIEAVEAEVEKINESLKENENELDAALQELDSI
ncbi:hypothetical protein [Ulvibacter litoralis]|uniref:Lipoprotein n=1 Tax=Ulvibacter litoralis TaxID=227084 RepID=A0A1G7I1L8_9FLAO|nr:hypothetical protein [Ulvibacter litoralis]GHC62782.1 hypothetical protein GCM10008083_29990 [Ulvibacter litoralis]SDF06641.1 hypothetical protein SAMN05421855_10552 [Ulvibacter litoralis]